MSKNDLKKIFDPLRGFLMRHYVPWVLWVAFVRLCTPCPLRHHAATKMGVVSQTSSVSQRGEP